MTEKTPNPENLNTPEGKLEALAAGLGSYINKKSSILESDQKALEALRELHDKCTRG